MATLFLNDNLKIDRSWLLKRLTVEDRITRRRVVADAQLVARLAFYIRIQAGLELTTEERDFMIRYIFERFGNAALNVGGVARDMFCAGDGQRLLNSALFAARGIGMTSLYDDVAVDLGIADRKAGD